VTVTSVADASEPLPERVDASSPAAEPSAMPNVASEPPAKEISRGGFWGCFASTFATIFLAELGDKTQVTTLLISAQSGKPWVVFLGAGAALIATSLLGVLLGRWLAQRLSARTLDIAAGVMLLAITAWLLWDIVAL
jgi:putative Ca2+/H+ antiporter (TMEM165/GDT1 family)